MVAFRPGVAARNRARLGWLVRVNRLAAGPDRFGLPETAADEEILTGQVCDALGNELFDERLYARVLSAASPRRTVIWWVQLPAPIRGSVTPCREVR